jgi:hypothetical protein
MSVDVTIEVSDRVNHVQALSDEVEVLKSRLQEYDTGYLHTTISVLEARIRELNSWIVDNY